MNLSKKLKQIRRLNHCTQKEFAKLLGIGYTTFQKYETGSVFPRFELLQKICKKFPKYTLWLIIDDIGVKQYVPALKEHEQQHTQKPKKHKQHTPNKET
jgi:transcriptional regulator with XRE-family HTH domain